MHWTALTPEEQDTAPAIQRGRSSLNGLTFTLRGGRELWVTDGQGRAVELTADFTSFLASYDMADVQAYPVPQGIRVEVYSRYGYETGASHTYPAAELKQRLAAAQAALRRPGGDPAHPVVGVDKLIPVVPVHRAVCRLPIRSVGGADAHRPRAAAAQDADVGVPGLVLRRQGGNAQGECQRQGQ